MGTGVAGASVGGKFERDAIVFIDGNNVYHNMKASGLDPRRLDFSKLSEFVCQHFKHNHKKSIYYNSIPKLEDGEQRYWKSMQFFERVEALPKFEVKKRKLQRTSTREQRQMKEATVASLGLCEACRPIVKTNCGDCIGDVKTKEKGIDVMIAVDMLEQSVIRDNCHACILISGDADFIPALKIIEGKGTQAFSASFPVGYSMELKKETTHLILDKAITEGKCFKVRDFHKTGKF